MSHLVANPDTVMQLLMHATRSTYLLDRLASVLEPEDLSRPGEARYQLWWAALRDYWNAHRSLPSYDILRLDLDTRLDGAEGFLTDQELDLLDVEVEYAYYIDKDPEVGWAIDVTQALLSDRRMRQAAAAVSMSGLEEMDERLEELLATRRRSVINKAHQVTGFRPGEEGLEQQPRMLIGNLIINKLLGGLSLNGEACGLIGGSGKGKTTFAIQLSWDCVREGLHSAYLTYENEFDPEYKTRFYGYAADIPSSRITGKSWNQLLAADQDRIRSQIESYGQYFHPMDMVSGSSSGVGHGGIEEIRAIHRDFEAKGIHIKVMVIDQLLPMLKRWMAARGLGESETRTVIQDASHQFMQLAAETRCFYLLLHQLNPTVANQHPSVKPEWSDAAECKSFAFFLQNCLAFGNQDHQGLCWARSAKVRSAALADAIVQLDGENFRFQYEPGAYVLNNRTFVRSTDGSDEPWTVDDPADQSMSIPSQINVD